MGFRIGIGPMSGLAALADGGEWRDWGWRFVCRRYRSVPAPVRSRRSGWALPVEGGDGFSGLALAGSWRSF